MKLLAHNNRQTHLTRLYLRLTFLAPSRSSGSHSVCLSVRLSGTKLSKALNLHLSLIGLSLVSLRSDSGQTLVSLRSVSCLSVTNSSDRRSLKYFVLLIK